MNCEKEGTRQKPEGRRVKGKRHIKNKIYFVFTALQRNESISASCIRVFVANIFFQMMYLCELCVLCGEICLIMIIKSKFFCFIYLNADIFYPARRFSFLSLVLLHQRKAEQILSSMFCLQNLPWQIIIL